MAQETEVGPAAEVVPGVVRGAGRYAVGNANGELFAVNPALSAPGRRSRQRVDRPRGLPGVSVAWCPI